MSYKAGAVYVFTVCLTDNPTAHMYALKTYISRGNWPCPELRSTTTNNKSSCLSKGEGETRPGGRAPQHRPDKFRDADGAPRSGGRD